MLVLTQDNSYPFANMVVKLTDNTVERDDTITPVPDTPEFNLLIPTVQEVGSTNVLELYYPGEPNRYLNAHGNPNPIKYGFGPDLIHAVLGKADAGVGVYTINLRGPSATMANTVLLMKYKVEKDVAYTDSTGAPYYIKDGALTTVATEAVAVTRDVMHVKFQTTSIESCKKWTDLHAGMAALANDTVDENGYKTVPMFGVMYRGASTFGNNVYFTMTPSQAEYDGNMYYSVTLFNGITTHTTDSNYSLDLASGSKYNTTYFVENRFNEDFTTLRMLAAEGIPDIYDLINPYLYTVDEFVAGTSATPAATFSSVNPFGANMFAFVTDEGSLNLSKANAFTLSNGSTGTETADALFESFFKGEILTDISSVLRYHINYIPDVGYNDTTKAEIVKLVAARNRMTTARLMVGGTDSFSSALVDHQAHYYDAMPNVSQIARVQSPMKYNEFIRRTVAYPAGYFDTVALMDHFIRNGSYYNPFAGFAARWTDYVEDTMVYPTETADFINSLQTNRINFVMKDSYAGAYLADQQMNTVLTSDQTELNNAFLISNMLYDLLNLVHRNHFKFNEAEEVRTFSEGVDECINTKYAPYSASLSVDVYRMGTIGRAKSKNKIKVSIDMKDINKFADVELVLEDS